VYLIRAEVLRRRGTGGRREGEGAQAGADLDQADRRVRQDLLDEAT
jgi:hypothetical protein